MQEKQICFDIPEEQRGKLNPLSPAESSRFVLRGLISYHERMTMGECPQRDGWLNGLKFALSCVEEKIREQDTAQR